MLTLLGTSWIFEAIPAVTAIIVQIRRASNISAVGIRTRSAGVYLNNAYLSEFLKNLPEQFVGSFYSFL